jgi:hypothetical protein
MRGNTSDSGFLHRHLGGGSVSISLRRARAGRPFGKLRAGSRDCRQDAGATKFKGFDLG